ncbi:MAG TPA: CNNM domain-containing protein [Spirochaetota bacterium]|nr:CNNM domain-containing protein [Spirochaetota bacterium]
MFNFILANLNLLFFSLLFFSAFFSGVESAFVTLNRIAINRYENSGFFIHRLILYFVNRFELFFIAILFLNLINNSFFTFVAHHFFRRLLETKGYELAPGWDAVAFILVITFLILIFGEVVPKRLAIRFPNFIAAMGVLPMTFIFIIFYPVTYLLHIFFKKIMGSLFENVFQKTAIFDFKEFLSYIKLGANSGALKDVESSILENLSNNKNAPVKSVLIPRQEMAGFNISALPVNMEKAVKEFRFNTIPVYDKLKDNIIGVLSKFRLWDVADWKDLDRENIKKYLYVPDIVPENKKLIDVLTDMYKKNTELVLVTDEYGGVEGVALYTDIVKKILGKYEQDEPQVEGIKKISGSYYIVNPQISISEINDFFNLHIDCSQAETIGGYIIEKLHDLPQAGTVIRDPYFEYIIRAANKRKILRLGMRKLF